MGVRGRKGAELKEITLKGNQASRRTGLKAT